MDFKIVSAITTVLLAFVGIGSTLISNNYFSYGLSIILIGLILFIFIVIKLFNNKTKSDKKEVDVKKEKHRYAISNHCIFSNIKDIRMKVRVFDFQVSQEKDACIKDYLIIKFKTIEDLIMNKLKDRNECEDCSGGCGYIQECVLNCIDEINKQAREIGIPEIFITKFMSFHQPHVDIYWQITSNICQSKIGDYCIDKIISHFYNLDFILQLTLLDSKKTLSEMNGELDNILKEINYLEKRKINIEKYNLVRYE